jgi:serine protease Do
MKRGLFFAFLCAITVGITAIALVIASFVRPRTMQSLIFGQKGSPWSFSGGAGNANAEIVTKANRGVVTVIAIRAIPSGDSSSGAGAQPAPENVQRGTGTGFIIDSEGYIVTNEHVIKDADRIRVKLYDGRERKAGVVGTDRATDLALIRIEASDLMALDLGDSDVVRVGDPVIAIGNPLEYERSVTAGIVSAKGRKVYEAEPFEDFIQTDAAINRGNSGGPLINIFGEVIGVNTVIRSDGRGISFAVPSNVVKRVVEQLRTNGYVARGYLGVTPSNLTSELRDGLGLGEAQGILVADVSENYPAARAGLQAYDVITRFAGREIKNTDDFFSFVANTLPQQQVELEIIRGGQAMRMTATLDQRPSVGEVSIAPVRTSSEKIGEKKALSIGFSVRENTPEVLRELRVGKLSEEIVGGVIVSEVDPLGPAADSRLSAGYVILEANRQPVRNLEDFQKVASQLREGSVLVIRYTAPYQRAIRLAAIRVGEG